MLHGRPWLSIDNGGWQDLTARHQVFPASQQSAAIARANALSEAGWRPVTAVCCAGRAALVWCIWQSCSGLQDLLLSAGRRQCCVQQSAPWSLWLPVD